MTTDDLPPLMVDGEAIAVDLGVHPATLSRWAREGLVTRHARDWRGRFVYSYDEVAAVAAGRTWGGRRTPRGRPEPGDNGRTINADTKF